MKNLLWMFLFMVAMTTSVKARLGETEDQLINRYGTELSSRDLPPSVDGVPLRLLTFHKQNWSINVYLYRDVSAREEVSKQNGVISKEGIVTLLDNFAQGHTWQYLGFDISKGDRWVRDDGCTAYNGGSYLRFYSKQLLDAMEAARKSALHPEMKGF